MFVTPAYLGDAPQQPHSQAAGESPGEAQRVRESPPWSLLRTASMGRVARRKSLRARKCASLLRILDLEFGPLGGPTFVSKSSDYPHCP